MHVKERSLDSCASYHLKKFGACLEASSLQMLLDLRKIEICVHLSCVLLIVKLSVYDCCNVKITCIHL